MKILYEFWVLLWFYTAFPVGILLGLIISAIICYIKLGVVP